MDTPNLDRLVNEGTAFEQMYVTSPSCSPSRASLFSGTYPHTNGVFRNDERWVYSWVGLLKQSGYRTVNVGKMHTWPVEGAFGYDERHVTENKDRAHPNLPFYLDNWDKAFWARGVEKPTRVTQREMPDYAERLGCYVWDAPEDLHADNFVPEMACMWLDRYKGDEPFFLQIGIPGPHPPYDPTAEYLAKYEGRDDLPEPIRYDFDTQPGPLRELRRQHLDNDHDAVVHLPDPTAEQMRLQRAHYYANVSMIDTQVGNILAALERRGVLDDTIIVFTSDHGDCLNDHGHSQKWNMFEATVRVPAIVWGRGIPAMRRDELGGALRLGPDDPRMGGRHAADVDGGAVAEPADGGRGAAPRPGLRGTCQRRDPDRNLVHDDDPPGRLEAGAFRRQLRGAALRPCLRPRGAEQPLGRPRAGGAETVADPRHPALADRERQEDTRLPGRTGWRLSAKGQGHGQHHAEQGGQAVR